MSTAWIVSTFLYIVMSIIIISLIGLIGYRIKTLEQLVKRVLEQQDKERQPR